MTSYASALMTPTEYKMKGRIMMATVTGVMPLEGVILEVVAVVVWPDEVETRSCVTTITKLGIWLGTVGTPLQPVGIVTQ